MEAAPLAYILFDIYRQWRTFMADEDRTHQTLYQGLEKDRCFGRGDFAA
jgi:hypothetical protein